MEDSILLFFTGYSRDAVDILSKQDKLSRESDPLMLKNLDEIKEMGHTAKKLLINGDIKQYGLLMHDHWEKKLLRSPDMCSEKILNFYKEGLNNGAIGGKLVGAGGGRIYLAKDIRQSPKTFKNTYKLFEKWKKLKIEMDPDLKFFSDISNRLEMFDVNN